MNKETKEQSEESHHLFNLYDNIVNDMQEKQLQKNLFNFIQSQNIYDEIVNKAKQKIDEQYHQRRKGIEAKSRIHKSSLINKHHMMKAELRFKMCQQVFRGVLHQIKNILQSNEEQHCLILIKLIVEGALRMFQQELHIRCLPKHFDIIQKVLEAAEQTFNAIMVEQTGRQYPIKLKINKSDTLQERDITQNHDKQQFTKKREDHECIGGVILSDCSGNITYKNTIDTRINILKQICLPIIRSALWPNLKQSIQNGKVL